MGGMRKRQFLSNRTKGGDLEWLLILALDYNVSV